MHSREATFIEAQIENPDEHQGSPRRLRGGKLRHRPVDKPVDPAIESFSRQLAERFSEDARRTRSQVQDVSESQARAASSESQRSFLERTSPRRMYLLLLAFCLGTGLLAAGALYFLRPHPPVLPAPIAQSAGPVPPQAALAPPSMIPAAAPPPEEPLPVAPTSIVEAAPTPTVATEERATVVDATPRDPTLNFVEAKELQTLLTTSGLTPGPVDGIVGPRTAAAIRRYEAREGLSPSGLASYTILQHLRKKTSSAGPDAVAVQ